MTITAYEAQLYCNWMIKKEREAFKDNDGIMEYLIKEIAKKELKKNDKQK